MKIVHFSFKAVKRVASIVVSVPLHVIYYFSKYVPRNNSRWVFSSWKGMAARGNSKYLIEYVNSKCGDVEVVWVTKNKEFGIDGLSSSVNAVYGYSFAGVWHLLTAGVVFVSHGLNDVVPYFTRGAVIVNLGHTTFSIKKMSFHEKINNMGLVYKLYSFLYSPYDFINPSYEIIASANMKNNTIFLDASASLDCERIMPLGLPKTDAMIAMSDSCRKVVVNEILLHESFGFCGNEKLILFLPTWRGNKEYSLFDCGFDAETVDNVLRVNNAIILINFHPFDEGVRKVNDGKVSDRVLSLSYGGDKIIQLLCAADVLITDYSSLFSDFIVYDRPMIFAKFRHEEYIGERSLSVDYDSLPGEIVMDWIGLIRVLSSCLNGKEKDCYIEKRNMWRDYIYSGTDDGKSSERICSFVKDSV